MNLSISIDNANFSDIISLTITIINKLIVSNSKSMKKGSTMKNLEGTKTYANLMAAFAGESMARNKYTYYASQAKKDGYVQMAAIFEETAKNEMEHAKLWFKLIHGGSVPKTPENLKDAAAGEHDEWVDMYDRMAKEAREEGFDKIADMFDGVGAIEKEHEERYLKLLANIEDDSVFSKDGSVVWKCSNCGHIHSGSSAPDMCPVCSHPKAYFEVNAKNY